MGLLEGKVAIITGAGGGIGRAHALLFAREGAKVLVNDVGGARDGTGEDAGLAATVAEEIKRAGGEAAVHTQSIAPAEGAESLVSTAIDAFGRVDILVNNAGLIRDKSFLKMDEEMWDAVIDVHLKGTFLCSQAFAKRLLVQNKDSSDGPKGGRIVNTSSVSGMLGNFGHSN